MKPVQSPGILNAALRSPRSPRRAYAPPVAPIGLGVWRMPSGMGMAEFALRGGGFIAPVLMKRPTVNSREENV